MELSLAMSLVRAMQAQHFPRHMLLKLCEESKERVVICFHWNQICNEQKLGYSKDGRYIYFEVHIFISFTEMYISYKEYNVF